MRRVAREAALRCGWCLTNKCQPSETSLGCTRYHNDHGRPCPCPNHEKDTHE